MYVYACVCACVCVCSCVCVCACMCVCVRAHTCTCFYACPGSLSLGECAELFDKLLLRSLRQECGGLQTVLRNTTQVFKGE